MVKQSQNLGVDSYERVLVLRLHYAILMLICGFILVSALIYQAWVSFISSIVLMAVFTWFLRHATRRMLRNQSLPDQGEGLQ